MATNDQAIREAAYQLWEQAGCPDGEAERFWLAAEQEYSCQGDMNKEDAELGKGPDGAEPKPKREPEAVKMSSKPRAKG